MSRYDNVACLVNLCVPNSLGMRLLASVCGLIAAQSAPSRAPCKSRHACSPHRQIWSLACWLACLCVNSVLKTHLHPPTATGVCMLSLHEGEVRRNRWQVGRSGREERKGKERSKICGVNAIVIVDIMRHATNHHRVRARMHGFVFEGVN